MPAVRRTRTVAAPPEQVWSIVSDPHHLPRWWPLVTRVEDATVTAWTTVMTTPRGRAVRADYMRTAWREGEHIAWRQELEGSPFDRVFAEVAIDVQLDRAGDGGTRVSIEASEQLRGRFRLGGFMVKRAAKRRLDAALDNLERLFEP